MEDITDASRTEQVLSPWVTLVTHHVRFAEMPGTHQFHSFKQADYVTMFAVTADGQIPLIRQYRPALERYTLELPSGLLEAGESPAQAAARELLEETGLVPGASIEPLGSMAADSGRLENRIWSFFTADVSFKKNAGWRPDPRLECRLVSRAGLKELVLTGQFDHALHLAVIGQAMLRGLFSFNQAESKKQFI
ncbi:MAG: NUDIX hydrolase [Verrucomicrobiota bacterium]